MNMPAATFSGFKKIVEVSMEDICRAIFLENRESIKIKKEGVAIKNLAVIFNATLRLSNRKGFQAMSLRDLSRESGLSMGALYSYFSSKDELLDIIQEQGRRIARDVLTSHLKKTDDPRELLRTFIRSHLYLTEVLHEWFYFSYMETKNLTKEQQKKAIESELETEQTIIDILNEGNRIKLFKVENTVLAASVAKAMLQDWYLKRWKYTRRKISVEEYARFVIDMMESFVLNPSH